MPPGSAMKASARSAISALRSCIESTTCSVVTPVWPISRAISECGNHPDHLAAGRQHRVGHDAHQADVAAAVDQAHGRARPSPGPGPEPPRHTPDGRRSRSRRTRRCDACGARITGAVAVTPGLRRELVAEAVHGQDELRHLRIDLELLPQPRHVHVHGARRGRVLVAPHLAAAARRARAWRRGVPGSSAAAGTPWPRAPRAAPARVTSALRTSTTTSPKRVASPSLPIRPAPVRPAPGPRAAAAPPPGPAAPSPRTAWSGSRRRRASDPRPGPRPARAP